MRRLLESLSRWDERSSATASAWFVVATGIAACMASVVLLWKFAVADTSQVIDLFKVVTWPVVVCVSLLAFREPLGQFLANFSQRVKKLSVFKVELELTEVTAKEAKSPVLKEIKSSKAMYVLDSSAQIFAQLQDERPADYVVIDLGNGSEWLSSRLFIVAGLFEQTRGVRCMVFIEGTGENAGRFIGTASLQAVRWSLSHKYPWYEIAIAKALTQAFPDQPAQFNAGRQMLRTDQAGFQPTAANNIARNFITSLQQTQEQTAEGWLKIHDVSPVWERAEWITAPSLRELLGNSLNRSCVTDVGARRKQQVVWSVLSSSGPFVAGVSAGKFEELFDRTALLEELAHHAVAEKNETDTVDVS